MNIKLYAYDFYITKIGKAKLEIEDFEFDCISFLHWLLSNEAVNRCVDYEEANKKIYLDHMKYSKSERMVFLVFKSAEYNKVRNVINTDTLEEKPQKKKMKNEGDEEKTCLMIKFQNPRNAIGIFQKNRNGIGMSGVMEYLNKKLVDYHRSIIKDNRIYAIHYNYLVSEDFIEALANTKRISALSLKVDSREIGSDFLDISEMSDVKDEMQVVFKPYRGKSIQKDTVKNFYRFFNTNNKIVRKITVDAEKENGEPISFDTEKIKKTFVVDVNDSGNGTPDIVELQMIMRNRVNLLLGEDR